jgi:large subunit ribosomal protein L23
MRNFFLLLRKGLVTEKSSDHMDKFNKYTFVVDKAANKIEIRQAVERCFSLRNKVLEVRTSIMPGKWRRKGRKGGYRPDWKKAVVTLIQNAVIKNFKEGG